MCSLLEEKIAQLHCRERRPVWVCEFPKSRLEGEKKGQEQRFEGTSGEVCKSRVHFSDLKIHKQTLNLRKKRWRGDKKRESLLPGEEGVKQQELVGQSRRAAETSQLLP